MFPRLQLSPAALAGAMLAHAGLPGFLFLAPEPVDAAAWQAKMGRAAGQTPQPEIHIRADGDLAYRNVAQIVANAARAGLIKLGFVADPKHAVR